VLFSQAFSVTAFFGRRNAFFGGSIARNRLRSGDERANHPGPAVAQSRAGKKQGGWEVFEADGVCPVYCGPNAREQALSYARQRAGYGRAEIQVLDEAGNVAETDQQ
jgi:hypothetical protein